MRELKEMGEDHLSKPRRVHVRPLKSFSPPHQREFDLKKNQKGKRETFRMGVCSKITKLRGLKSESDVKGQSEIERESARERK